MEGLVLDPRVPLLNERIKGIKNVIPVISSKGGVGKSLVSSSIAWNMRKYKKTGLLDLDLWGASAHIVLNLTPEQLNKFPDEEKGIVPVNIDGLKFMSAVFYTGNKPLPLRGLDFSEAFLELMSVTRWDNLDYLFIDMPPGLNDPILDVLKYFKNSKFLIVATPSKLALNVVQNTLELVKSQGFSVIGLIENMSRGHANTISRITEKYNIDVIGSIPYMEEIEDIITSPDILFKSRFFKISDDIAKKIIEITN